MKTRTLHRALSILLTAAMVLNLGLTPVFAAEGITPPGVSGVCTHHTDHTGDCGYQQGTPCTHEHKVNDGEGPLGGTEDCYTKELTCTLLEGDAPEIATDSEATLDSGNAPAGELHTHDEDCYTKTDNCKHTHDETCGYTFESPCTFDTASCTQCKPGDKQPEQVCTCPPVDSGAQIHGRDCPLYIAPALSEAVQALIVMVDALPSADTITDENRETIKPAFETALTAYEALTGDHKAVFEATEQYKKLMALHTALYSVALMASGPITLDISGADKYVEIMATGYKVGTEPEIPYDGDYIITGTATGTDAGRNHVTVSGGIHNITIKNADIKLSDNSKCAFVVENNSTVNLTLEGVNVLQSGRDRAGLEVNVGNTLTITGADTDSLTATGGEYGSGIGSGKGGAAGTINISGGTVTATGVDLGAGIGGGEDGAGGTVNISGGTVSATGGWNSAGIGGGDDGAGGTVNISGGTVTATGGTCSAGIGGGMNGAGGTVTIRENAVVFATSDFGPNHIGEGLYGFAGTVNRNGGILFEGTEGLLYGTNVTPTANFTIPGTNTLTIAAGETLTMNTGITVSNNGTIANSGTITNYGTLKASGTQSGAGTLTGSGIVQINLSDSMVTLLQSCYVYTGSPIVPTVTVSPIILWGKSMTFKKDTDYTVTGSNNTAVSAAAKVIVTPKGGNSALTGTAVEKTFDITTANSALALTTNKVGNTVTYGDTITFTASVSIPATRGRAAANTVDFYCGSEKLNDTPITLTESGGTGTAAFTYNTTAKKIPAGAQTITARYGGSGNLYGTTQTVSVTLNKKPIISAAVTAGQSKAYDGNSNFTGVLLALNASDVLSGDTVTATADGTAAGKDAGVAHGFTCTNVTLGGIHGGFYSLAHSAVTGNTVAIDSVAPTYSVTNQKIKIDKTLIAVQAAKTAAGVNSETVVGRLTWAEMPGGNALPDGYVLTGAVGDTIKLFWTFAPTNGNYKTLSGSTIFTLTDKEVPILTVSNIEKTYDGKAVTTVAGTAKVGEIPVAGIFTLDGVPPAMQDIGAYNVVVKFTPTDSANYETATTSITVTIGKATITIKANNKSAHVGDTAPALGVSGYTVSGLASGETLETLPTIAYKSTPDMSKAGKVAIVVSGAAAPHGGNYNEILYQSGTLTISKKSGGGGSSSGGNNSVITPPDSNKPNLPATAQSIVYSKTDKNGNAAATIADKDITNAIDKVQKEAKKNGTEKNGIAIILNVMTDKNATSLCVTLLQTSVSELIAANVTSVTVKNDLSTVTLDLATLKALAGGDVVLTVRKADTTKLSQEAQAAIGNRPVFQYSLTSGGKTVNNFNGGRAGLQIPYLPATTEQADNLCGVYVDASGKVNWLEASSYDPITGMMLISAQHFSTYGIGYKQSTPKFTDVGTHWAKNDIDFVVARGLLTGTSSTTFAPDTSMARGMFVTALGRLAGVDTEKYQSTRFTDVKADACYAPYVTWANANNIVNGTTDTTFSPDAAISRQEMAVMLVNYSKAIGYKLPSVHAEVAFTDASNIASWAKNESGQWMYIQDGRRTTGEKTIDGTKYTFDQHGVTTALPPERKYLTYTVQTGDSF